MRDGFGILTVAAGLAWTLVSRDRVGLVIALAGVTLLAYGVLKGRQEGGNRRPTNLPSLSSAPDEDVDPASEPPPPTVGWSSWPQS